MGINQKELEKISEWFNKSNLTSATIEYSVDGNYKITISREQNVIQAAPAYQTSMQMPPNTLPQATNAPGGTGQETGQPTDAVEVTAPIVGTFYRSPGPDSPPFIQVGDVVKQGETICIIEAMKVMNELEAEFDMEIVAIKVDNGSLVEFGQGILEVKPL